MTDAATASPARPLSILMVQRIFHPNTLGWVEGFRSRGHHVRMLVNHVTVETPPGVCDIVVVERIEWLARLTHRLLPGGGRIVLPRPLRLWRAVSRDKPDLVMVKCQGNSIINQGPHILIVSVFAAMLGARRLSWGNRSAGRSRWERLLAAVGIMPRRHVRTVPSPSEDLAEIGSGREPLVPYAVVPADGPRPSGSDVGAVGSNRPVQVLTVGSFRSRRKRVWWTLEAAHHAGLLNGEAHFVFVGVSGPRARGAAALNALIDKYDCAELVTIRPDVPFEDMAAIYAASDLLVLPGHTDPFGMVVLEAMTHQLPVIVSDSAGAEPFVTHRECGYSFPDDDLEALADALSELVRQGDTRAAMGRRAREVADAFANPEVCAAILEDAAEPSAAGATDAGSAHPGTARPQP